MKFNFQIVKKAQRSHLILEKNNFNFKYTASCDFRFKNQNQMLFKKSPSFS